MCSTPKRGSSYGSLYSETHSLSEEMSAEEYSDLVQHANYSFECRQQDIRRLKSEGIMPVSKLRKTQKKDEISLFKSIFNFGFLKFIGKQGIYKSPNGSE